MKRWDIPLVGCIPELQDLSCPTMADYSKLLQSPMISGSEADMRYFTSIRLALAPVNAKNLFKAIPNQLVITVRSSGQWTERCHCRSPYRPH